MNSLDRRHFLIGSLSAAALAPRAAAVPAGDTITAGFIGTGGRAQNLMGQTLENPGVKIIALCDIKPDRLDKAATMASRDNPATFRDYHELLERKDVDAVFIATPCDLHVEMAIAALQAGKHVYCEKPVGITPESIQKLINTARSSKTVFQVGQQMRSFPTLRQIIAKVHAEAAGKIIFVKAQRHASDDLAHDGRSADWFFFRERSGDVITEMSVHNLDVCNWVTNSRPERAAGFGGTLLWKDQPPGRTNMDGYTLSYDYANGVKMSYTQVFFHPRGLPGGGQYTYVYTTEGAVDLDSGLFYPRARGAQPVQLNESEADPRGDRDLHVSAFFDCIRTGKKPPAGIEEGAVGALTAILGREAIYRNKVMTWSDLGVRI
jgi:predicted dehydrogenase